jgi:hypothetical protein
MGSLRVAGLWSPQESQLHINLLEMKGVLYSLMELQVHLPGQALLLFSDNVTCISYLKKQGGTSSPSLCDLTKEILLFLDSLGVSLQVRHIPSSRNVLADALSRIKPLTTEWSLDRSVFLQLQSLISQLSVDRFATRLNNQLVQPVHQPLPRPGCHSGGRHVGPVGFSGHSLCVTSTEVAQGSPIQDPCRSSASCSGHRTMLAPPRQSRFPDLVELSVSHALRLPVRESLLVQGKWIHPNPSLFYLHAWLLSGIPTHEQVIPEPLPRR